MVWPGDDSAKVIYGWGAPRYREAGWRGVLPLPPRRKKSPPVGFSGWQGKYPDDEQIKTWIATRPNDANLLLRLQPGQLGLDVDGYEGKKGGTTLMEASRRWGPLPPTYRNSARADDQVSGHLLFRVPERLVAVGDIKFDQGGDEVGDIDLIQPHHRFVVCWPSIHPKTGQRYRWYAPDGSLLPEGEVPRVDGLPYLPEVWVEALRKARPSRPPQKRQQHERQGSSYGTQEALTPGEASPSVLHDLKKALRDLGWKP